MRIKQTIQREDGSLATVLDNGSVIITKPLNDVDAGSEPVLHYGVALEAVDNYMAQAATIAKDQNLSDIGKQAKLSPLAADAIAQVAMSWSNVDSFSASLEKRMAALCAVPQLLPGDFVNASIDREIRTDWWGSLDTSARWQAIAKMADSPELQRVELALLRSPVPVSADDMLAAIRASWDAGCRANNIAEEIAIQAGRANVDWAQRGLAQLSAALNAGLPRNSWPAERILNLLVTDPRTAKGTGYGCWGWSARDAAEAKRTAEIKGLKAA